MLTGKVLKSRLVKDAAVHDTAARLVCHGVTMVRTPAMTNPREFQVIAPHLNIEEGEAEGVHYDIQTFRVNKTMISRVRGNIESVAWSIKMLALLTWALLEADLLYSDEQA